MTMHVLLTRPEADAAPVAEALRARGLAVTLEPLLTIRPLPDAELDLEGVQALLFTSASGARAFAARAPERELPVFAVGDATAAAARAAGFDRVESAAGDVPALAGLVRARLDPADGPLLHAAGSIVAGDLAGLLEGDGFRLRRAVLYEAVPADRLSPAVAEALADGAFDLVLFFSSRTAETFARLVRHPAGEETPDKLSDPASAEGQAERLAAGCARAEALCLSQVVAEAAGRLPWQRVRTAERPDLPAMLDLVDAAAAGARMEGDMNETAERRHTPEEVADSDHARESESQDSESTKARAAEPGPWAGPAGPAPGRRSGAGVVALAAAVAAAVALALVLTQPWWSAWLGLPPGTPAAPTTAALPAAAGTETADRLAAAERQLSTLGERLDGIDGRLAALGDGLAALRTDLAAIDTGKEAALPPAIAALPERLDGLDRRIADLAARADRPPEPAPETRAALGELRTDMGALRTDLADLEQELGDVPRLRAELAAQEAAAAGRAERATLLLAAAQLRSALATDRPFAAELAALRDLAGDAPGFAETIEPLAAHAESGIPTLRDLQAAFPDVARAVAQADQAETLGAAPASEPNPPGWVDRTLARLASLVTVRPVGGAVEGESSGARVARAEARLAAGDLGDAVEELSGLTGAAAQAAADWLVRARARLAAEAAAGKLQTAVLGALGQGPEGAADSPPAGG